MQLIAQSALLLLRLLRSTTTATPALLAETEEVLEGKSRRMLTLQCQATLQMFRLFGTTSAVIGACAREPITNNNKTFIRRVVRRAISAFHRLLVRVTSVYGVVRTMIILFNPLAFDG